MSNICLMFISRPVFRPSPIYLPPPPSISRSSPAFKITVIVFPVVHLLSFFGHIQIALISIPSVIVCSQLIQCLTHHSVHSLRPFPPSVPSVPSICPFRPFPPSIISICFPAVSLTSPVRNKNAYYSSLINYFKSRKKLEQS